MNKNVCTKISTIGDLSKLQLDCGTQCEPNEYEWIITVYTCSTSRWNWMLCVRCGITKPLLVLNIENRDTTKIRRNLLCRTSHAFSRTNIPSRRCWGNVESVSCSKEKGTVRCVCRCSAWYSACAQRCIQNEEKRERKNSI